MIKEKAVLDALPKGGFLPAFVRYAMRRCDAPTAYHVPVGIALLSAIAPKILGVPWAPNEIHANTFGLLVGPSSDGKTTAIGLGTDLLMGVCPDALMAEPGSAESLLEQIADKKGGNDEQYLIIYKEFGSFLSQTARGYAKPIRERYSELFDANPTKIKYRARSAFLEAPRISILAGCAPLYLQQYTTPVDWEGGFLSRFYTILAEKERRHPIPLPRKEWEKEHHDLRVELDNLFHLSEQVGPCGGLMPDAAVLWEEFYSALETVKDVPERVQGAVKRSQLVAIKCAQLIAYDMGEARLGDKVIWMLSRESLEVGIKLAQLHIQSVISICEQIGENPDMRDRLAVLRTLRAAPERALSFGEVLTGSRLLPRRAREILEGLVYERFAATRKGPDGESDTWQFRPPKREAANGANGVAHDGARVIPIRPESDPARPNDGPPESATTRELDLS